MLLVAASGFRSPSRLRKVPIGWHRPSLLAALQRDGLSVLELAMRKPVNLREQFSLVGTFPRDEISS